MSHYLVLSAKHSPHDGLAAWWGPHRTGYYTDLAKAGRYSLAEALDICFPGHSKAPPASFAVDENLGSCLATGWLSWKLACERFIPDGQPVQQGTGRIVIGGAP